MWNKIKSLGLAIFDRNLHYVSFFVFLTCLFVHYSYSIFGLFDFIFLACMSFGCFTICYLQGVKNGEGVGDLIKIIEESTEYIRKAADDISNTNKKDMEFKFEENDIAKRTPFVPSKYTATGSLNFPPRYLNSNGVKIVEIKEITPLGDK